MEAAPSSALGLHQLPQQFPPPAPPAWVNMFDLNLAPPPTARPPASFGEQPSRHRLDSSHRDGGGGILGSHPPCPVTGTSHDLHPLSSDDPVEFRPVFPKSGPLPKLSFPKFDGENPMLWKDRCEMYFEVYPICDALKPCFAALNFSSAAASWLQTFGLHGRVTSWESLCSAVCDRFDRNQYQLFMKQLDTLRQTDSVAEYYARFEQLSHQILLYNSSYDDVYFVTRFLGGLKKEIHASTQIYGYC